MIFEIISGGEKTDWVGKEWAGLFFPRGKNGPAIFSPGKKLTGGKFWPVTPERLQWKTLLIIDEHGSKMVRNSVFDCHLSPV